MFNKKQNGATSFLDSKVSESQFQAYLAGKAANTNTQTLRMSTAMAAGDVLHSRFEPISDPNQYRSGRNLEIRKGTTPNTLSIPEFVTIHELRKLRKVSGITSSGHVKYAEDRFGYPLYETKTSEPILWKVIGYKSTGKSGVRLYMSRPSVSGRAPRTLEVSISEHEQSGRHEIRSGDLIQGISQSGTGSVENIQLLFGWAAAGYTDTPVYNGNSLSLQWLSGKNAMPAPSSTWSTNTQGLMGRISEIISHYVH